MSFTGHCGKSSCAFSRPNTSAKSTANRSSGAVLVSCRSFGDSDILHRLPSIFPLGEDVSAAASGGAGIVLSADSITHIERPICLFPLPYQESARLTRQEGRDGLLDDTAGIGTRERW